MLPAPSRIMRTRSFGESDAIISWLLNTSAQFGAGFFKRDLPVSSCSSVVWSVNAYATTSQRSCSLRLTKGGMKRSMLPCVTTAYQRAGVDFSASSGKPMGMTVRAIACPARRHPSRQYRDTARIFQCK
jgi:hypothetical protein